MPLPDIMADTVARAFYAGWISRFGPPARITSDQGRQFESSLFQSLSRLLGAKHIHTTPYHPASNGLIENLHRPLKAAIKCFDTPNWVDILPTILMGFRATLKEDLHATPSELVYGATIPLPGEFLHASPSQSTGDATTFVAQLRRHMEMLRPAPTSAHSSRKIFVQKELAHCSHVFVRHDGIRKPLQPPYTGPFKVVGRNDKVFKLLMRGTESCVNIDRLKPAFMPSSLAEPFDPPAFVIKSATASNPPNPTSPPPRVRFQLPTGSPPDKPGTSTASPVPAQKQPMAVVTRSGRRVIPNRRYVESSTSSHRCHWEGSTAEVANRPTQLAKNERNGAK